MPTLFSRDSWKEQDRLRKQMARDAWIAAAVALLVVGALAAAAWWLYA